MGGSHPREGERRTMLAKTPGCAVECARGDGDVTTLYVGERGDVTRLSLGGVGTGNTGTDRVMVFSPVQMGGSANVSDLTGHFSVSVGFP